MGWSYTKLWQLLIARGLTREKLRTELRISSATIAKMGRGENVSMDVLDRICKHLGCRLEDVVEHVPGTRK